ncbi:PREDICTED: serine/threonine-protein phosphatase 7 long form homolog isoform X2 [Erythranthe guttata]|uniref:serine/threonine-protein phosphatase 7 long form homolog isoform X2 n=1 Tax=Erythranthe guttata TaxID=4155 RepID=UPI00064E0FC0|nr:PREDICTED: serine/threonine-protein phosphatase 7 long form homolog isoform X2 [Erythranthe guttata]|eukprot:XP_012841889.1 PREDICTED: serine/threonine-protein phosphatase 7 long form homolog isoform X2 [Erythranthe guttata]
MCGDKGFTNALIECEKCQNASVHRYCLDVIPDISDEYVRWLCDDCKAEAPKGNIGKRKVDLATVQTEENNKKTRRVKEFIVNNNASSKQRYEENIVTDINESTTSTNDSTLENKVSDQRDQKCISSSSFDSDTDRLRSCSKKKRTVVSSENVAEEQMHVTGSANTSSLRDEFPKHEGTTAAEPVIEPVWSTDSQHVYGPRDASLLYLQAKHRSQAVMEGAIDETLRGRRADKGLWSLFQKRHPHRRVLRNLVRMGFYGVYRCGRIAVDYHLITALVERWRQETHTFHFRTGEATVTLQDVALMWGLRIEGRPVTGVDVTRSVGDCQVYCQLMLGFTPTESQLRGGSLHVSALASHMKNRPVTDDSSEEHVEQYTRGLAFMLFGGVMCSDKTSTSISLMYLQNFEVIDEVGSYSWGSAVLAFLYRELCWAAHKNKSNIGGPLQLLQIWAWMRISPLTPVHVDKNVDMSQIVDHDNVFPIPPYGARWIGRMSYTQSSRHSVRLYRAILDQMLPHQFSWQPYDRTDPEFITLAKDRDIVNQSLWLLTCPLICFSLVEIYRPERVLRQFGMRQHIPSNPSNPECDIALHKSDRRGNAGRNWEEHHNRYIFEWRNRYKHTIDASTLAGPTSEKGYDAWYERHTRRFVSPVDTLRNSGLQIGDPIFMDMVADKLTSMSMLIRTRTPNDDVALNDLLEKYAGVVDVAACMLRNRRVPEHMLHMSTTREA